MRHSIRIDLGSEGLALKVLKEIGDDGAAGCVEIESGAGGKVSLSVRSLEQVDLLRGALDEVQEHLIECGRDSVKGKLETSGLDLDSVGRCEHYDEEGNFFGEKES